MAKKTKLRKLKEQADELVKQIVRLRDDWHCQKCGRYIIHNTPEQRKVAHTAHIIPKSQGNNLRWDLLNIVLLDFHCHQGGHIRADGLDWFKEKFGARWEYLNADVLINGVIKPRRNHIRKFNIEDMKYLIFKLTEKLEELQNENKGTLGLK